MTRGRKPLPATVDALSNRIENWRRSRLKRGRMPEDLWREAADLARRHGVTRISEALGVGFASLKRRAASRPLANELAEPSGAGFVELRMAPSAERTAERAELPEAVVSLSRSDGSSLVVELRRSDPFDVVGLVKTFLPLMR